MLRGFQVYSYLNIEKYQNKKFDLYVIDGPWGSSKYSRYDIVNIVKGIDEKEEFIIIMDDRDRIGEKQTVNDLLAVFKQRKISVYLLTYKGEKEVAIFATSKYKHAISL